MNIAVLVTLTQTFRHNDESYGTKGISFKDEMLANTLPRFGGLPRQ